MLRRADEQVLEIAESVLAKHIAFITRDIPADGRLAGKYVEMILPEIDHHFLQLPFGINGAQNSISRDLRQQLVRRPKIVFL